MNMVDDVLPIEKQSRPLSTLFLDLNAYFASVEQQERPELRGEPVAVVPVDADTSFVIAASYEAKRFGVKCGTMIRDAKRMCPGIAIVKARPSVYVGYHHRVLEVVENVLPVDQVCSIDEMRFRLIGAERDPVHARELALSLKRKLREDVGPEMRASIGIATNPFLAKIATEIQKPDGLVVLQKEDLPERLYGLKLTDFTGINKRMAARLNAAGIFSAEQMLSTGRAELRQAFGSIIGERWWYLLRGYELPEDETDRKTLSHSHVLAPSLRNDQGCREVLMRLLQKASARLRSQNLCTTAMSVRVSGFEKTWEAKVKLPPTQDTITMNDNFMRVWETRDFVKPRSVSVCFYELHEPGQVTPSLFEDVQERAELMKAMDGVNQKFGKNTVFLAGMEKAKDSADEKIAFQKTWLFQEGKGDNEWMNTFRGLRD
jgi:DNA polymerase-4